MGIPDHNMTDSALTVACLRITPIDSFPDEVCEVQRIADVGHPAEQISQADHAKAVGHVDDGKKVLP